MLRDARSYKNGEEKVLKGINFNSPENLTRRTLSSLLFRIYVVLDFLYIDYAQCCVEKCEPSNVNQPLYFY